MGFISKTRILINKTIDSSLNLININNLNWPNTFSENIWKLVGIINMVVKADFAQIISNVLADVSDVFELS